MYTILYISFDRFYTEPGDDLVNELMQVVHREGVILESCDVASRHGVDSGTSLSEAKTILRDRAHYREFVAGDYSDKRTDWLETLLLFSDEIESGLPHEAWINLSNHIHPVKVARECVECLQRRFPKRSIRCALAPAKWMARLVAAPYEQREQELIPADLTWIRTGIDLIDQLPTLKLSPVSLPCRKQLEYLGYRWARQIREAPLSVLTEQFGHEGFYIYQLCRGQLSDPVYTNFPERTMSSHMSFEAALTNKLDVEFVLKSLCQDLAMKLNQGDWTCEGMRLVLENGEGQRSVLGRDFPRPVQTATSLHVAAFALWQKMNESASPLAIRVLLTNLQRAPRRQQSIAGYPSRLDQVSSCETAVKTLEAAFGERIVQRASALQVPRRVTVLREWKRATGWQ